MQASVRIESQEQANGAARGVAGGRLKGYLLTMVRRGASDLHLVPESVPVLR